MNTKTREQLQRDAEGYKPELETSTADYVPPLPRLSPLHLEILALAHAIGYYSPYMISEPRDPKRAAIRSDAMRLLRQRLLLEEAGLRKFRHLSKSVKIYTITTAGLDVLDAEYPGE